MNAISAEAIVNEKAAEARAALARAQEHARRALAEDDAARAALARSQATVEAALSAVLHAEADALAAVLDERLAKAGDDVV